MSADVLCPDLPRRPSLPARSATVFAALTAMTFSASGAAPTPLYQHYQQAMSLSSALLTVIFAAYTVSLLAALLTAGSLSDHLGRRPVIAAALVMNILAMAMFGEADTPFALIAARAVQGFATGVATATLGATILDFDRTRGPLLNSMTAFLGLSAGSLFAGALATWAPDPERLVYVVLLAVSALELVLVIRLPETVAPRAGALASLRPDIRVPPVARDALLQVTPVNVAFWALGGFYFSLMPGLVRLATGLTQPIVGGAVVSVFMLSGAIAVLSLRRGGAPRLLGIGIQALVLGVCITLGGVHLQSIVLMMAGTTVVGMGFGATLSGSMQLVMPLAPADQRAGLLSAFYVESYLAFTVPAVLAGLAVPAFGLKGATFGYGAVLIVLGLIALAVSRRARR